jgi:hypothetical protein
MVTVLGPATPPLPPPDPLAWIKDLTAVAGGVLSLVNQQKLNDTNMKRAAQGLPPITMDQVPGAVPTAAVNIGVENKTRDALVLGGVGLLAILGLRTVLNRKRR